MFFFSGSRRVMDAEEMEYTNHNKISREKNNSENLEIMEFEKSARIEIIGLR